MAGKKSGVGSFLLGGAALLGGIAAVGVAVELEEERRRERLLRSPADRILAEMREREIRRELDRREERRRSELLQLERETLRLQFERERLRMQLQLDRELALARASKYGW